MLFRSSKGERGAPVPWADPKVAPWFDQKWLEEEQRADEEHLRALGQSAEDWGFTGVSKDLVAQSAFAAALKASRTRIRFALDVVEEVVRDALTGDPLEIERRSLRLRAVLLVVRLGVGLAGRNRLVQRTWEE